MRREQLLGCYQTVRLISKCTVEKQRCYTPDGSCTNMWSEATVLYLARVQALRLTIVCTRVRARATEAYGVDVLGRVEAGSIRNNLQMKKKGFFSCISKRILARLMTINITLLHIPTCRCMYPWYFKRDQ